MTLRFSIGQRFCAILAACVLGLAGLAVMEIDKLGAALQQHDGVQVLIQATERELVIGAAGMMVMAGAISLLLARSIAQPLLTMTGAMTKLGRGDLDVMLPALHRGDEVGAIARAIEAFRITAVEKAKREAEHESERREWAERAKTMALQEMAEKVENATNDAVSDVAEGTGRMARNASLMNETARALEKNSSSVAAAADEALANAETVARASSQLAHAIGQIAAQVNSSRALTLGAVTASQQAETTISKLTDAAAKVGSVTSLISEIASQTNLLALNATIEAARAGDAGRGFSVVAQEVKSLAEQTARATAEIAQQIAEMKTATDESVQSMRLIGEAILNVDQVSSAISAAIDQQNAVTSEISRTVADSSMAAKEVAAQIASVSAEATETGRRASEICDGSAVIATKVDELRASLIRVIRSSTKHVDRRSSPRRILRCAAELKAQGRTMRVRLHDLALGGALLDQALPELALDTEVFLIVDGLPLELKGFVARKDAEATLIKFKLSEAQSRQLEARLLAAA